VPFLHFFDGFRTSHEVGKIAVLDTADLAALVDAEAVLAHRRRGLTPDAPQLRGSAQNPDVYFQAREAANPFHDGVPEIVEQVLAELAGLCGRQYGLVDYVGAADADRVVVLMGSGAGAAEEAVEALCAAGEPVGVLKVRLYRPFPAEYFVRALPPTVRSVAVLDRTKEPGATGEPLLLDVIAALHDAMDTAAPPFASAPHVIGGRYGLSSKEFRPAHVKQVFDELARFDEPGGRAPKRRFTVGIRDDVTGLSLDGDDDFRARRPAGEVQAVFFGLGADGTVGANKASV
jgi:pyruvate-ferredoxin/flavodoxin oxidoreductase